MILTARLELVPMTVALANAELAGSVALAAALDVPVPDDWPPELYEADDLRRLRGVLADPDSAGWALHYLVRRLSPRVLVGVAGFAGKPAADGSVELGYSVVTVHRRQGFASEAVGGLVAKAFGDPVVRRIVAQTLPGFDGSIAVLLRNGFALDPTTAESNVLRYELLRPPEGGDRRVG
jgi:ribosomal-protein-alanine N-acetyltransferase